MQIYDHQNYSDYLRSVMSAKTAVNPRFSMRGMARLLGIAPSFLLSVLKKTKNFSPELAIKVATRLGLDVDETEYFCLMVQKESAKEPVLQEALWARMKKLNPDGEHQDLSIEHFRAISDSHHFAILACLNLSHFVSNAKNLSAALAIPLVDIEIALDRLERLEMIEPDGNGGYRKTKENPRFVSVSPDQALRNFHRQTLTKAIESLETQTPAEKVIGSETFAIDREQIDELRALADTFFDRALALAKKSKKKDAVYHLGVQCFDLTPSLKNKVERKKTK